MKLYEKETGWNKHNPVHRFFLRDNLMVSKEKKHKEWYEKIIGMKTVEYRPPEFLEMKLGKNTFYIETYNPKRADGFKEVKIGGRTSIIFAVKEIHKFVERAEKSGARIVVRPVQQFWGGWNAVIADPDDNEFILDEDQ